MLRFPTSSPSLRRFITVSTMYSSSRFNAGGRSTWRRGFCQGRGGWGGGGGGESFVGGDSHLDAVRDSNYGHRQGYRGNNPNHRGNQGQGFRPRPLQPFQRPPYQLEDYRKWIDVVPQPPRQSELFTVLSYNILADYLARDHRSKLYSHIPHHILDWEWRKKRLFLEFGLWSPDILCLQEVDKFHDLENELAIRGYAGIWKMRTGNAVDGCAIFWRRNRFHLRQEEHIEFNKLGLRDNVAQICVLESRIQNPTDRPSTYFCASSNQSRVVNQVVICNIHVLYNPKRGELKLAQVRLLLERAYAVSRTWNDAPVIICGDFNSTPQSPLYKFISEQKLSLSGLDRNQISGQHAASIHTPQPYSGSGLYRPQHINYNCSERKDVEYGNNFKGIDNSREPHSHSNNAYQNEHLPPAYSLTDLQDISGKPFSVSKSTIGDDKVSDHMAIERDEVSLTSSNSEPCSVNYQLEHGGNRIATQIGHSMNSRLSGCLQSNEGFPNELICSISLDSSSDHELSEELEDLLVQESSISKSDPQTSVEPIMHPDLTGHVILNNEVDANQVQYAEVSQSNLCSETLFDEPSPVNTDLSTLCNTKSLPALAIKEEICVDTSSLSYSSTCTHPLPEVDRKLVGSLDSNEDRGKSGSADMLACSDEDSTVGITEYSISVNPNPEESNNSSENSCYKYGSYKVQLEGHGGSVANLVDDLCNSEESSDPNFLKELIGTDDACDVVESFGENNLHNSLQDPSTAENLENSCHPMGSPAADMERHYSNLYSWTPMEIEVASGKTGCTLVEHSLKLRSAYADVEDHSGTKASSKEPEVTSYNRLFMGTVDYIWYSEGLQNVKVLDTIPKHVLKRTPGFPTRRWGSDHLALACQLAFTKGVQTTK